MTIDQRLMRLSAENQCRERAEREGETCNVYRRIGYPTLTEATWYVRSAAEGPPEGVGAPEYTWPLQSLGER